MPIIKQEFILPIGELGIWLVDESIEELLLDFHFDPEELPIFSKMSEKRKKEWLVSRILIQQLSGRKTRIACVKDEYGKPHLPDSSYHISISHSRDRVAVLASPYNIGIDIQEIVDKMHRISVKFVSDIELAYTGKNIDMLHVLWGAKESMYKAWGKKGIDFKDDMKVDAFEWDGYSCETTAKLEKGNITMNFIVIAKKIDNYILVYAREKFRILR